MCCPYSATIHSAIIQPLYILHYSGALFATIQILFVPPPFSYCTVYIPAPVSYCTYVHFSFFTFCQHSTTVQCAFCPNSNTICTFLHHSTTVYIVPFRLQYIPPLFNFCMYSIFPDLQLYILPQFQLPCTVHTTPFNYCKSTTVKLLLISSPFGYNSTTVRSPTVQMVSPHSTTVQLVSPHSATVQCTFHHH